MISIRSYGKFVILGNLGNGPELPELSESSEFSMHAYVTDGKLGTKILGNLEQGFQITWQFYILAFNVKKGFSVFSVYRHT